MSNSEQQVLNWAGDGAFKRAAAIVDDKPATDEADPSRKCSTCEECWHYCMEGTSP